MLKKTITVEVKTNAKQILVEKITEHIYKVRLSATPIAGKANKQLIDILSDYFKISKSQVEIKSGKSSKNKIINLFLN